jgi:hypothetical protein
MMAAFISTNKQIEAPGNIVSPRELEAIHSQLIHLIFTLKYLRNGPDSSNGRSKPPASPVDGMLGTFHFGTYDGLNASTLCDQLRIA